MGSEMCIRDRFYDLAHSAVGGDTFNGHGDGLVGGRRVADC